MEPDLSKLSKGAPPPREAAKREALAQAMAAFDAEQENHFRTTQGSSLGQRLIHIATSIWSGLMNQRLMTGSALAMLMLLPAAGYVSWQIMQDQRGEWAEARLPVDTRSDAEFPETETAPKREERKVAPLVEKPAEHDVVPPAPAPAMTQAMQSLEAQRLRAQSQRSYDMAVDSMANDAGSVAGLAAMEAPAAYPDAAYPRQDGGDRVQSFETNGVKAVADDPVSTFSADVDTASYAMVRQSLKQGRLPAAGTVRVEELINYFDYDYPRPDSAETPFRATVTVTPTPWNEHTRLLHIGVKGYDVTPVERPRANLVFLIDVSGSMNEAGKLPLLKSAFRLLIQKLDPHDTVAIVTYAGNAGTVLEPTPVSRSSAILNALDTLQPGGSTAGAAGLEEAYRLAQEGFVEGGVNRVMLATDGDFNVGPSDDEALKEMIERKRESGVFLSVFGFGQGNYNDQLMQAIAQNGNGIAAYIDTLSEAEKTLVQEASASLFPIASDVKFQVEFNPSVIAEYRQIGFETRALNREDFNNDRVDAGEIGSGHTVTAIYEITPVGSPAVLNSKLRYGETATDADASHDDELAYLKIRAKRPGEAESRLSEIPVSRAAEVARFAAAPQDVRFSIAVAAFGQKLRRTDELAGFGYDAIEKLAADARGADAFGYRSEFLQLVRLADGLDR